MPSSRQVYFIDRLALENRDLIEFELASVFDLAGVRAPKRQCVTRCQWKYRGEGCGYTGTNYFTANDVQVYDPAQDVCGKRISSCGSALVPTPSSPTAGFRASAPTSHELARQGTGARPISRPPRVLRPGRGGQRAPALLAMPQPQHS